MKIWNVNLHINNQSNASITVLRDNFENYSVMELSTFTRFKSPNYIEQSLPEVMFVVGQSFSRYRNWVARWVRTSPS